MLKFTFPEDIDRYTTIENVMQLRELLNSQINSKHIKCTFKINDHRKIYLYAKCRKCDSSLRYKYQLGLSTYQLTYSNNDHKHQTTKSIIYGPLIQFIKDLPSTIDLQSARDIASKTFSIKKSTFYYYYSRLKYPRLQFKQLIAKYDHLGYEIQLDPYAQQINQLPQLLILTSPKMKQNFQMFGQWCSIDTTYNIINEKAPNSKKQYKIGCIMGLNYSLHLIPFAFFIMSEETKQRFYQLLKTFIQMMPRRPNAIISDQSIALKAAIADLRSDNIYQGLHLLDLYHILKNVKKKITNKNQISLFSSLAKCRYPQQFQILLKETYQQLPIHDLPTLTKFIENSTFYCYSQIENVFFGLSISDCANQKLHDLIKPRIKFAKPFTVCVNSILEFLQQLSEKAQSNYHRDTNLLKSLAVWPFLKQVIFHVDKRIYREIFERFMHSINCNIIAHQENQFQLRENYIIYHVRLEQESQLWRCDCKLSLKSGLPCPHELKVYCTLNLSFIKTIHQRWILPQFRIKQRKPRGKLTRRNLIK